MKLTLTNEYLSLKPLLFLLYSANIREAKTFKEVMDELRRGKIARQGDIAIRTGFFNVIETI